MLLYRKCQVGNRKRNPTMGIVFVYQLCSTCQLYSSAELCVLHTWKQVCVILVQTTDCGICACSISYRTCAVFGRKHRVIKLSLAESVSTNQTALRTAFARMIGVVNLTMLFNNSFWSHDEMTKSHDRTKAREPKAIAVENSSLCHKISELFLLTRKLSN